MPLKSPLNVISHIPGKSQLFLIFSPTKHQNPHFLQKNVISPQPSHPEQLRLAEVEREKQRERDDRKRKGLDTKDIDEEDQEDYMGVMPLIEKLKKEKMKDNPDLDRYEEPTDSDSEEDDEWFPAEAKEKR